MADDTAESESKDMEEKAAKLGLIGNLLLIIATSAPPTEAAEFRELAALLDGRAVEADCAAWAAERIQATLRSMLRIGKESANG